MRFYFFATLLLIAAGCGEADINEKTSRAIPEEDSHAVTFSTEKNTAQLNVTLLLDLSDRIDPKKNPGHYQRDTALIGYIIDMFLNEIRVKGNYLAKGKFRVIFYPVPPVPEVGRIVHELDVNLAATKEPKLKRDFYRTFRAKALRNIAALYEGAIRSGKWPGADIWGFFKRNSDLAIDPDPGYRNMLVILSDGYLVDERVRFMEKNRYSYLTSSLLDKHKLRNNAGWKQRIETLDFGLIAPPVNLSKLEVLFLEMNPLSRYHQDEDILRYVLEKWFREMKVKRSLINQTGFPEHSIQRIRQFLAGT